MLCWCWCCFVVSPAFRAPTTPSAGPPPLDRPEFRSFLFLSAPNVVVFSLGVCLWNCGRGRHSTRRPLLPSLPSLLPQKSMPTLTRARDLFFRWTRSFLLCTWWHSCWNRSFTYHAGHYHDDSSVFLLWRCLQLVLSSTAVHPDCDDHLFHRSWRISWHAHDLPRALCCRAFLVLVQPACLLEHGANGKRSGRYLSFVEVFLQEWTGSISELGRLRKWRWIEAMAGAGRLYHDSAGAIKNKPEAERADAQEQLGPPFVYVWVAFLRSLASTKELGAEHVAVLKTVLGEQRVEERTSAVGIARSVLQSEAVQESRGQGRVDAHCVLPGPDHPPPRGSTGGSIAAAERGEEIRPRAKRPPRARSSEAPDADAREIERLARRVAQHSQRMAELLRRGVLEPSLAYAFLMTKGGQRIPQAKSKAKARASSRATTSEGAEAAPNTSPPRLPPERPPMVFTRGETMEPSNAGPEVRTSRRAWRPIFRWTLPHGSCARMTEFLLLDIVAWHLHKDGVTLDIVAWPLHKNDIQDLRWVDFFLNDTEIWLAQGWHAQIRSFFFFPVKKLMAPCSRMTRTNRVAWKIEGVAPIQGWHAQIESLDEESMAPAQRWQFVILRRLAWPMRKATHNFEFEWLCLHPVWSLKGQRWSTVAASVVSTGAIGPSVHPPDEAPAGLSLSSQRVRL